MRPFDPLPLCVDPRYSFISKSPAGLVIGEATKGPKNERWYSVFGREEEKQQHLQLNLVFGSSKQVSTRAAHVVLKTSLKVRVKTLFLHTLEVFALWKWKGGSSDLIPAIAFCLGAA